MDVDALLRELSAPGPATRGGGGYWVSWPDLDVRAMATLMRDGAARFVTVTATPAGRDTLRIIYHWDVDGELVNVSTTAKSGKIPTISDIVPAADWVERELRDYYGLEFDGRPATPPLMLREGDPPGLFTRTRALGKGVDPAQAARAAATDERRPAAAPASGAAGEGGSR